MSHSKTTKEKDRFLELDGLRALAVVSVILFHCEVSGLLSAGFFGVDIFFMISGFILTAKMLDEYRETGKVIFPAFYFRRLKRLMPPVFGLIVLAGILALTAEGAFEQFRWDVAAALAYVSNLWQIWHEQPYFGRAPVVLKHLWSLALEEQFYFIWPGLAYLALKRFGNRGVGTLALLLTVASTARMIYLYQPDIADAFKNRLYLGSDTHAMGLFAGAALAGFWNPWSAAERQPMARNFWRVCSVLALAALTWLMQTLNNDHPATYQGIFLLVPVLTCVVAYTVMGDHHFLLSRLFRTRIVQWIGLRSYSLYLVHWPLLTVMRLHGLSDFSEPLTLLGALVAIVLLAEMLYRCTELPMKKIKTNGWDPRLMRSWVIAYTAAALATFAIVALYGNYPKSATDTPANQESPVQAPVVLETPSAAVEGGSSISDEELASNDKISGGDDLFAVGDSVLKGAQAHLEKVIPGIRIDAAVGRQASQGLKVVQAWRAAGGKAQTVLVHLGTNGYITESQYRALLGALADRERVLLVNVHVPKPWMKPNNEIIHRMPADFPNVRVIDWNALSATRPAFFGKDNTHLTMKGIRALTAQIKEATGGTVIMPSGEQDTMLAKSKEPVRKEPVPDAAPATSKPAPEAAARNPAAPAHKEAPAAHPAPATEPPAAHEAGDKVENRTADQPDRRAENHAAHASPPPAEAPPVD